jgi:hypothetical protein
MDQNPLVTEEIDAGEELLSSFNAYAPVESAFWLNPSDDGRWSLYIASGKIDDSNLDVAYGEVLRIVSDMNTPHLDPFQVKLIGSAHPLARAAVEINRKYPGPVAKRFRGKNFGGVGAEEVFIYPPRAIAAVN